MARLIFAAADARRVVEHSLGARTQRPIAYTTDAVSAPAVILVHDQGVYLMSNGEPRDRINPKRKSDSRLFVAYAQGCDPEKDSDWWDRAHALVGGDDFSETLPYASDIKDLLDNGATHIIIALTAKTIQVSGRFPRAKRARGGRRKK